jgi:hypothetical protein
MSMTFTIDLLRPGRAQRSRRDWFLGVEGGRHLVMVAAASAVVIAVVMIGGVLPGYVRYSSEVQSVARLRGDLAAADKELATRRASLRDLDAGALRQVRWAEVLPALSRWAPEALRIERVSLETPGRRAAGKPPAATAPTADGKPRDPKSAGTNAPELLLQIDASSTLVPGGARLVEIANFMAALANDPAVTRRFHLKTWEVRRPREQGAADQLQIGIAFAEKRL